MTTASPTVHATAVLVGTRAVLIRGPAGAGKSRLALALIEAAQAGALRFATLVGDDRVHLEAAHGRVLVRPTEGLRGLIEVRGLGIRRLRFEPLAVVGFVVDLQASDGDRLPSAVVHQTVVEGIPLPRLAVAAGAEPMPMVLAALRMAPPDS